MEGTGGRRYRFRTIRQRRRRAHQGQVSAVATTLTLLLIVTYLANYIGQILPQQMAGIEFERELQVQNQLLRLQATILAQAERTQLPLRLLSPISLGSGSEPPFGTPELGAISSESDSINETIGYQLDRVSAATPAWGTDSACLAGGAGTCSTNGVIDYANLSANGSSDTVTISGSNDSLVYNINGDNDSLTVKWTGANQIIAEIVVNGSYDTVTFDKSGTDAGSPSASIYFFGIHDKYAMSLSGSHSAPGGTLLGVQFIGSQNGLCPYDNNSATDSLGTLGTGGTKLNMSVTWWNADGYATDAHTTAYSHGSLPGESLTWSNATGFTACPFLRIDPQVHSASLFGGLDVELANRYSPTQTDVFEFGAVLYASAGGQAVMVGQPDFTYNETHSGLSVTLNLVELNGNVVTQDGVGTASVQTYVTSVSTSTFGAGVGGLYVQTPYYLNVTTLYPAAWYTYFNNANLGFPYGASCVVPDPPLAAGYSCLEPPPNTPTEIVAPLYAQTVTVHLIQVSIQVL